MVACLGFINLPIRNHKNLCIDRINYLPKKWKGGFYLAYTRKILELSFEFMVLRSNPEEFLRYYFLQQ
jgi:hypothetical protein